MPVRIAQENLSRTVGTFFPWAKIRTDVSQVLLPSNQVVHLQREVIASTAAEHRFAPITDKMQLLAIAQTEPRPGKIKCGSHHRRQSQHPLIEVAANLHIGHVDGHVIEFADFQLSCDYSQSDMAQLHFPSVKTPQSYRRVP